jgi:two-component system chemotaxis sensor kinase CheA
MSGFNLSELLPFYLDETDEHIAGLNDALLRLEQDPSDAKALQEAFRMFHSIKGASVVMGFVPVNRLTHHLESLYEELRSKRRLLDRPTLDLTFRCLDELRDYHRSLRSEGQSSVDLSVLTETVVAHLSSNVQTNTPKPQAGSSTNEAVFPPAQSTEVVPGNVVSESGQLSSIAADVQGPFNITSVSGAFAPITPIAVIVTFEQNLPLADMKARLICNRLAERARVVSTEPPIERLDDMDRLTQFVVNLFADCEEDELRGLADVEGVVRIQIEPAHIVDGVRSPPIPEVSEAQQIIVPPAASEPLTSTKPSTKGSSSSAKMVTMPSESAMVETSTSVTTADLSPSSSANLQGAAKSKVAETIRVDSDRLDHLMNLAGELVITKARFVAITRDLEELFRGSNAYVLTAEIQDRLDSIAAGLERIGGNKSEASNGSADRWSGHVRRLLDNFGAIQSELNLLRDARERLKALSEAIHSLGRVSDGLQKGVLKTRMVPIGPLFERFRRVCRDLSISSGKEVLLEIGGEKTELDKRMIDELSDPLIHMVRNAVDHGLETPNEREAAGKPRPGTVSLLASHRGNSIMITVSDDGRGINCERIREKIVAKGLIGKADAAELSDRELITYIWHPGLSTAETITEISGRGVGMDIVKSRIENLNGTFDVRSVGGQGTTFVIRLPLTLAIMSSLLVRIYDEIYAIPLDHINEIVEIRKSQIYRVHSRPAIEIRKKIVALVALGDIFRWGGGPHPGIRTSASMTGSQNNEDSSDKHTIVVVQNGETTIGLLVDELIGMQEVVLKSLEKNFRPIPGLSGASILGDGRVSLILDLDAVIDLVPSQYSGGRA